MLLILPALLSGTGVRRLYSVVNILLICRWRHGMGCSESHWRYVSGMLGFFLPVLLSAKGGQPSPSLWLSLLSGVNDVHGVLTAPLSRDPRRGRTCVRPSLLRSTLLRGDSAAGPQSKAFPSSVRNHGIVEVYSMVGDEVSSTQPATPIAASQRMPCCNLLGTI